MNWPTAAIRWSVWVLAPAALLLASPPAPAQELPTITANAKFTTALGPSPGKEQGVAKTKRATMERWIVIPVTTELQRLTLGPDARAYVLADGDWFKQKRVTLDVEALNLSAMHQQLTPYADPMKGKVHFHIVGTFRDSHFTRQGPTLTIKDGMPGEENSPDYVTEVLRFALIGFGREAAGFREATADAEEFLIGPNDTSERRWETTVEDLKRWPTEDFTQEEEGKGNDKCRVYPVRAALSRVLYSKADCVLHFVPGAGGIEADDVKVIAKHIDELQLKERGRLFIRHKPTGLKAMDLVKGLGFQTATMQE